MSFQYGWVTIPYAFVKTIQVSCCCCVPVPVSSHRSHLPSGRRRRLPLPSKAFRIHFCQISHEDLEGRGICGQEVFLCVFSVLWPAQASSVIVVPSPVVTSETRHAWRYSRQWLQAIKSEVGVWRLTSTAIIN